MKGNLSGSQLGRVTLSVEEDVAPNPGDVRLFIAAAVVTGADGLTDSVEEPWRPGGEWRRLFHGEQRSGRRRIRQRHAYASHRWCQHRSVKRLIQECRRADTPEIPHLAHPRKGEGLAQKADDLLLVVQELDAEHVTGTGEGDPDVGAQRAGVGRE